MPAVKTVAIVGGSGGIGAAMIAQLLSRDDVALVHATRQRAIDAIEADRMARVSPESRVRWTVLDVTDEAAIAAWLHGMGDIDWLINCVGMLHDDAGQPEKTIRSFDPGHFQRSMAINCLPTLLLGKYALPVLRRSSQPVFATLSARVGSIEDNALGGWYSYRCSKAALNMALKCLSVEWGRAAKHIRVAALHPGTTDTALSVPFQRNVPDGKLFPAQKTARLLIEQIDRLQHQPSGRFIAYDGAEIPW